MHQALSFIVGLAIIVVSLSITSLPKPVPVYTPVLTAMRA
jgi:hypothetical protein